MYCFYFNTSAKELIAVAFDIYHYDPNPSGGGLASGFSASNNIMGCAEVTDMVEKITWAGDVPLGVLAVLDH